MWLRKEGYVYCEKLSSLGYFGFTTTREAGAMTDKNNRESFAAKTGFNLSDLIMMEQVHGANVREVSEMDKGKRIAATDGFIAVSRPGNKDNERAVLGILTADCVPVFGINRVSGTFGAFHAGWRGIEAGIIEKAAESLGEPAAGIFIALGPHICGRCYKTGSEFAQKFPAGYTGGFMQLADEITARLAKAGVAEGNVDAAPEEFCTYHNAELFYSYRRAGGHERMLSALRRSARLWDRLQRQSLSSG